MITLGINISHDSSLSVIKDGEHIFSLAEERLNRIKVYTGFPFLALRYITENNIVKTDEIDSVTIASAVFSRRWAFTYAFELTENKKYYDILNDNQPDDFFIDDQEYLNVRSKEDCKKYVDSKISKILSDVGIKASIEYIDHHLAHASAAYYSSGFNEALSITMDGVGDRLSSTISICKDGEIKRVGKTTGKNSVGLLYSEVTKMCGFKVARHEGKITGLAAYGNYKNNKNCFDKLLKVKNGQIFYIDPIWRKLKRVLLRITDSKKTRRAAALLNRCGKLSDKDLSASIQHLLEKKVVESISYWVDKTGIQNVVLGGGLFANVKINQYISEIPNINNLFIFPNMGDGGNAYGAAANSYFNNNRKHPTKINNVYLGPEFTNEYINNMLINYSGIVEYNLSKNICKDTAKLVSENKIIGWFQGRMEYGPRALGNRSIIASPVDATINKWLNDRMKRTEFMPFAPSCLYDYADELFDISKESMKYPAQFMTVTFNMKKKWADRAPAVSHIDQTARPQLVTKEGNPKYYQLLEEYYKITGLPLLINTSFNVHEEPIVCTPEEGLNSLLTGVIDFFCVGDYICTLNQEA